MRIGFISLLIGGHRPQNSKAYRPELSISNQNAGDVLSGEMYISQLVLRKYYKCWLIKGN